MDKIKFSIPQQEGMKMEQWANAIRDYLVEFRNNYKGTDTDFYIEILRFELDLKENKPDISSTFILGSGRFTQINYINEERRQVKKFNPDLNHPDVVYYKWMLYRKTPFNRSGDWITNSKNFEELNNWERDFISKVDIVVNLIGRIEDEQEKKRLLVDTIAKINELYNKNKEAFSRAYVMLEQIDRLEKLKGTTNKQPQPTINSYFTPETKENTIIEIQSRFKEYNGKKMAILIYLLSKEYKILNIVPNSKTNSRVGFVRLLTGNDKINMQGIDKWLIDGNLSLTVHSHEDYDYQNIKKELEKILQ